MKYLHQHYSNFNFSWLIKAWHYLFPWLKVARKCGQSAGCCFKPWFLIQYYLYDLTTYTSIYCLKFQVLDNTIDKVAAEVLTAEELKERELKKQVGYRGQIHLLMVYFLIPRLPFFLTTWISKIYFNRRCLRKLKRKRLRC